MRRLAPITPRVIRQRAVDIPEVVSDPGMPRGFDFGGTSRIELSAWLGRLS